MNEERIRRRKWRSEGEKTINKNVIKSITQDGGRSV